MNNVVLKVEAASDSFLRGISPPAGLEEFSDSTLLMASPAMSLTVPDFG